MLGVAWLRCLVAVSGLTGSAGVLTDDDAVLLLDRRLVRVKGQRVTSFVSGSAGVLSDEDVAGPLA
jgi:hypothetical protein